MATRKGELCGHPGKSGLARRWPWPSVAGVTDDLCLILETSTRCGSAALADEATGQVIDERRFESERNHNARMFGPLEELLAGGICGRITRVLAGSGPGSYSGTRVGIAVAQGIAIALGCPAVTLPSLIAVDDPGAVSLAIGDARRGHWWWARIRGRRMEAPAPEMGDADALRMAVETAVGERRCVFTFEEPRAFGLDFEIRRKLPQASGLWQAWREASHEQRRTWAAAPPQPCYLKPPHITAPKRPWLTG